MINDRPIDDPKLQKALNEVKQIMHKYGFAGACMLVAENEAAFTYGMHAPWSAIRPDPTTPLGFRFTAKSAVEGKEVTHHKVEGAMHTICQLCDFGVQTFHYMDQLKAMLKNAGIDFEHTPFGGQPLPNLDLRPTEGSEQKH